MALEIKQGDLFANVKAPCLIVHGCNAQGRMASGFAEKLRNRFPEAYTVYKAVEREKGLILGDINGYTDHRGYTIINAITQEFYGRDKDRVYVDYKAVEDALTRVAKAMTEAPRKRPIHLPLIGGGLANGDKDKLVEIFTRVFADVPDVTLWLH